MSIDDIKEGLSNKTNSDGSIDYIHLHEYLRIINKVGSTIIGYLVVAIMILVPLIISLEVIYVCFPIIRDKIDDLLVKVESNGVLSKVIGITLRDAKVAVERANTVKIGEQSAIWIYLKIKLKSQMFLAFIIALVLNGSSVIFKFVWRLFNPIFSLFS